MKELLTMLEHRVPGIRQTDTWRKHSFRWVRNYQELQGLRNRKPEVYEEAVVALVNYIANRAARELQLEISFNEVQHHTNAAKKGVSLKLGE